MAVILALDITPNILGGNALGTRISLKLRIDLQVFWGRWKLFRFTSYDKFLERLTFGLFVGDPGPTPSNLSRLRHPHPPFYGRISHWWIIRLDTSHDTLGIY